MQHQVQWLLNPDRDLLRAIVLAMLVGTGLNEVGGAVGFEVVLLLQAVPKNIRAGLGTRQVAAVTKKMN